MKNHCDENKQELEMLESRRKLWISIAKNELIRQSSMSVDECHDHAKELANQAARDYGPSPSNWGSAIEYVIEDMRYW